MRLLCVRTLPGWSKTIGENPLIQHHFGKPILISQLPPHHFEDFRGDYTAMHFDHPIPQNPQESLNFLRRIFIHYRITHALVVQKLLWYSTLVEQVAKENGAHVLWCEIFFDDRVILDYTGLQYCRENDLRFDLRHSGEEASLPKSTREFQNPTGQAEKLKDTRNPVVVLGQVPFDMALEEYPGLNYLDWLRALFTSNPETTFLFKHHPHPKGETPGLEAYHNVQIVDDTLDALFEHFEHFASFSSTTIFEGSIRDRKFITGGYHLCSGCGVALEAPHSADLSNVREKLRKFVPDQEKWEQRLRFVCGNYALPLNGEQIVKRLLFSSRDFFACAAI